MNDIVTLFNLRKQAIKNKDQELFDSTQLSSIGMWNGNFNTYTRVKDITIEILAEAEDELDFSKYVFVKESFKFEEGITQQRFVMYGLIHTVKGWKVTSAAHSSMPREPLPKKHKEV